MNLIVASDSGDIERVRSLLEEGTDPNVQNRYGNISIRRCC